MCNFCFLGWVSFFFFIFYTLSESTALAIFCCTNLVIFFSLRYLSCFSFVSLLIPLFYFLHYVVQVVLAFGLFGCLCWCVFFGFCWGELDFLSSFFFCFFMHNCHCSLNEHGCPAPTSSVCWGFRWNVFFFSIEFFPFMSARLRLITLIFSAFCFALSFSYFSLSFYFFFSVQASHNLSCFPVFHQVFTFFSGLSLASSAIYFSALDQRLYCLFLLLHVSTFCFKIKLFLLLGWLSL